MELPKCQKCNNGILIPLSDYGQEGASVMYKAGFYNPLRFSCASTKAKSLGKKIEHQH